MQFDDFSNSEKDNDSYGRGEFDEEIPELLNDNDEVEPKDSKLVKYNGIGFSDSDSNEDDTPKRKKVGLPRNNGTSVVADQRGKPSLDYSSMG